MEHLLRSKRTLSAVLATSARGLALPEHLLTPSPQPLSLGSQTSEPPSYKGEEWSRCSQELGSLGHSQTLPLASVSLRPKTQPSSVPEPCPTERGGQTPLLRNGIRGRATYRWKSYSKPSECSHTHSCVGPTSVSTPEASFRLSSWSVKPAGHTRPCTACPTAWHAQATIPAGPH